MRVILPSVPIPKIHSRRLVSPVLLYLSSIAYAAALAYCLEAYAAVEWPEYGFSFGEISVLDACALCVVLLIWAAVVPKRIRRPSSLVLVVTYLFVCVPAVVAMVGLEGASETVYYPLLSSLALGFFLASLLPRCFSWREDPPREYSPQLLPLIVIAWVACLVVLIYSFGSVMTFVGLDDIYTQREQGKAGNLFEGYIQTYFGYVFSPALLAFGLVQKNYLMVVAGIAGSVVLYMISAEKAVFMYPLFMIVLFIFLRDRSGILLSTAAICLMLSFSLFFTTMYYNDYLIASFLAWYLGVRSLLFPGTFVVHYSNYFNENGYTFGTQISGVSALIKTPMQYEASQSWPSVGHLVGEGYLGIPTLNANASFIASDGVASLGLAGILIAMVLLSLFLIVLDAATRGVRQDLSLLILLPLSLTLTNGSLFTAMISFGGLPFLLMFMFCFRAHRS